MNTEIKNQQRNAMNPEDGHHLKQLPSFSRVNQPQTTAASLKITPGRKTRDHKGECPCQIRTPFGADWATMAASQGVDPGTTANN